MTPDTIRTYWLWFAILAAAAIAFFSYPGGYAATAHSVLHGLCAQTPSHTFLIGDRPLPFDARMTGIYTGLLAGLISLAARRRLFAYGNPNRLVIAALTVFVGTMAIDGTNSLLNDLSLWHPYRPANVLRLVTGYLAGLALAVVLAWLLASSLWRLGRPHPGVEHLRDLAVPVAALGPSVLLLLGAPASLHVVLSTILVLSAWLTLTVLMLVLVLLSLRLDEAVLAYRQLHVPVAMAAMLGLAVMLGLAEARFWLERTFGISNAML